MQVTAALQGKAWLQATPTQGICIPLPMPEHCQSLQDPKAAVGDIPSGHVPCSSPSPPRAAGTVSMLAFPLCNR